MSDPQTPIEFPIDTAFDIELANKLARLETYNKHYYRPNTYLHKWWARRCGTTFRLILKQLVQSPQEQDYYAPGGLQGKIILDPMMGGGTTLHEALRLGANVIGMDLDPIPVLQARATMTDVPLSQLEEAFGKFYNTLHDDLGDYFKTTCPQCDTITESWYTLYGARRTCDCGDVLLVDSLILRHAADGSTLRLCAHCRQLVENDDSCPCAKKNKTQLVERSNLACPDCRQRYKEDLRKPYYARYEPLVVSGHCSDHNLFLRILDPATLNAIQQADKLRSQLSFRLQDFAVVAGRKSIQLLRRGITNYLDLFSSRQLLVMDRAIELLPQIEEPARLNLALLLSTSLEFNSMLCGYKGKNARRPGAVRHAFAHHAYAFPYTALENNPLYSRRASGTLQKLFHARIRRARLWAAQPRERSFNQPKPSFVPIFGERDAGVEVDDFAALGFGSNRFLLRQRSATTLDLPDDSVDAIVTDPPYFDSVQYSDLSAFFRVWLRLLLPDEQKVDWAFDLNDSAVDPHNDDRASRYTELIGQIFAECNRVLDKTHGRLIFTFHHWNPKAWTALTVALHGAGFTLLNRYVVHSENPISVHIANMNALTHDAILVLAPSNSVGRSAWKRPPQINTASSAQFCTDCATLLGWMLDANLTPEEIRQEWKQALAQR